MPEDVFELVDNDYENCQREEYPRQIKTRKKSFNSILQKFTDYRIRKLKDKLEAMKGEAVTAVYSKDNYEKKLGKKSEKIARLEEKIMLLSKEDVPTNYVKRRAIKLKKKMCDNLKYTTGNWYAIGLENKELVFDDKEPINVESSELDRKTIENSINEEFVQLENDDAQLNRAGVEESINEEFKKVEEQDGLDRESIEASVNEEFTNLEKEENIDREAVEDSINEELKKIEEQDELDRASIENSINDQFAELENKEDLKEYKEEEPTIGSEEIKDVNDESFEKYEMSPEEAIPEKEEYQFELNENAENKDENDVLRVTRNNSSNARISRFDEDGNERREYNYVPMTDEEIRESQEKLGFDEHGNLIEEPKDDTERKVGTASLVQPNIVVPELKLNDILVPPENEDNASREMPVIVPEREEQEYEKDNKSSSELDEYNELREKILYLKQQREITRKQREDAQKNAEETAEKAKEVYEMFEESEKNYAQSIDMLKAYTQELEDDCNRNIKGTEDAENDRKQQTDSINSYKEKLEHNNRIINEIDMIIKGEEENRGFSR